MKVVILGNTKLDYSWFVKTYRQGLKRNGVDVYQIDYKTTALSNIKQILLQLKADIVFTHLSFHVNVNPIESVLQMYRDVHKKVGTIFAHTCNDAREVDRYMGSVEGAYQVAFVGTYALARNCQKAWNIPVYYMPYSSLCYESMAKPVPELSFQEPVFTGSPGAHRTGWVDNRAKFIEDLQQILPLKIFQTQSANDLRKRSHELSASARCILGLCVGYEINGYMDVRPFQYLGSGACMIMRKFPNTEHIIPDDLYYTIHSYDQQGVDDVKYLWEEIKRVDTNPMRKKAFDYIQQNHSCKVRMAEVLQRVKEL
jgi:hypothetical protein